VLAATSKFTAGVAVLLAAGLSALSATPVAAQDVRADLVSPVNPRSALACPSPDVYSRTRPDPPGTPTLVGVAMFFHDVSNLNDGDQTITADVTVMLRWRDTRLADQTRGDASADCPVPGTNLWVPVIEPDNLRSRQQYYEPRFLVNGRGTITYARRLLVQIAQPLDLRAFPFDRHEWRFTVWPVVSTSEEVVFAELPFTGRNERMSLQGWTVGAPVPHASLEERRGRLGRYARFDVALETTRESFYYVCKLGVPLVLITLMAYGVYFIPTSAVAQQIGLSMTSMLTLIAYMLALSGGLPRISYLTKADRFYVGAAILVFLGLMKAILTIVLAARPEKMALVERADRTGRWLYPVGMVLNGLNAYFL